VDQRVHQRKAPGRGLLDLRRRLAFGGHGGAWQGRQCGKGRGLVPIEIG
jgi:hypothetical protein